MTNLNYNDALKYASKRIAEYYNRTSDRDVLKETDEELARRMASELWNNPAYHEPPYETLQLLVNGAKDSPPAWRICIELAEYYKGQAMPEPLHHFLIEIARGVLKEPKQRGRKSGDQLGRDTIVVFVISELRDKGIHPTRNEYSQSVSGCDVVAEAFQHLGENIGYDNVRRIWIDRVKELIP